MNADIVLGLKNRYNNLPTLIVSRSIEHAKNEVELFEILESFPTKFPIIWNKKKRRWKTSSFLVKPILTVD